MLALFEMVKVNRRIMILKRRDDPGKVLGPLSPIAHGLRLGIKRSRALKGLAPEAKAHLSEGKWPLSAVPKIMMINQNR